MMLLAAVEAPRAIATDWVTRAALAAADVDPVTGKDPEWGKAAPAGILIWVILGVALFLLIKSMNRHIRRVPESFEDRDVAPDGAAGSDADDIGGADLLAFTDDASAVEGVIPESDGPDGRQDVR